MEQQQVSRLQNRDYVLLIDKSGSMGTSDMKGGRSRWKAAQETTEQIAREITALDPDGIKVVLFGSDVRTYNNVTADKVHELFQENSPGGSTGLTEALDESFKDYLSRKKAGKTQPNGEIMVVMTDGEPDDESSALKSIVNFGNQLDNADEEYGIEFVQVGQDAGAARFLKTLDDDLTSKYRAKYDIVNTKNLSEVEKIGVTAMLEAALDD